MTGSPSVKRISDKALDLGASSPPSSSPSSKTLLHIRGSALHPLHVYGESDSENHNAEHNESL